MVCPSSPKRVSKHGINGCESNFVEARLSGLIINNFLTLRYSWVNPEWLVVFPRFLYEKSCIQQIIRCFMRRKIHLGNKHWTLEVACWIRTGDLSLKAPSCGKSPVRLWLMKPTRSGYYMQWGLPGFNHDLDQKSTELRWYRTDYVNLSNT